VPDQVVPVSTQEFQYLVKSLKGNGETGKAGKIVVNVVGVNSGEPDKPAEEAAKRESFDETGDVSDVAEDAVAAGTGIVAVPHNLLDFV